MQFPQPGKEAQTYGRRGAAKSTANGVYRIEGEYVTMQDIAKRIGTSAKLAQQRLAKLKSATGPITWVRLGA
jgi:hypothetical protein